MSETARTQRSIEDRLTDAFLDERAGGTYEQAIHAAATAYARQDYATAGQLLEEVGH